MRNFNIKLSLPSIRSRMEVMRKKDAKPITKATRRVSKQDLATLRRSSRELEVQAMREGRRNRAVTFIDRKKEGSRRVCRGKVRWN